MDFELIFDALWVSLGIAIVLVVVLAAIIYAFLKKKKDSDYQETGIPNRVEKPERTEGSSRPDSGSADTYSYEPKELHGPDKPED